MNGGNAGDFDGGCRVRRCHLNGKNAGADKQRKMGEKVTEIEFFEVGNHAENGHLSADKVTKCSDKVFVLKKTLTLEPSPGSRFSSKARGLLAPGPLGYFLCEQKVPKKSLKPTV